jgi:hypothetical protein
MNIKKILFYLGLLLFILAFSNSAALFNLAYCFIGIALIMHTFSLKYKTRDKIFLTAIYVMIYTFQAVYINSVAFGKDHNVFLMIVSRIIGLVFVLAPFTAAEMISKTRGGKFFLPSIEDIKVFTFNELAGNMETAKKIIEKGQQTFTKENIDELLTSLPRHSSFRYINKGSLTGEYFESAYQTLDDPNIYIIVSNTGSPASEIISIFTRKQYNHASLSFDRELKTIISYNGGEKIYPPGLNAEMVKYFNKKEDASVIVYSLPILADKKRMLIDKIKEINEQGNAYNMLGLALNLSFKPNIMYCSQFVYKMLKLAGVNYFEREDGKIKPTDLVELDYERKLRYEYKIQFGDV